MPPDRVRSDEFERWLAIVRITHRTFRFTPNQSLAWTPLQKPLSSCQVALVTTTGAHLRSQRAFDVYDDAGDASYREIPDQTPTGGLQFSHTHYDTTGVTADPNVALPIDRLRELISAGIVRAASPVHLGFMGFVPDPAPLRDFSGPAAARRLRELGNDIVVITPG